MIMKLMMMMKKMKMMKKVMMMKILLPKPLSNKKTSLILFLNSNSIQICLLNKTSQVNKSNLMILHNRHNRHLRNLKIKAKLSKRSFLTNLSSKLMNSKNYIFFQWSTMVKLKNSTQQNLGKKC